MKILSGFISVALLATLAACGGSKNDSGTAPTLPNIAHSLINDALNRKSTHPTSAPHSNVEVADTATVRTEVDSSTANLRTLRSGLKSTMYAMDKNFARAKKMKASKIESLEPLKLETCQKLERAMASQYQFNALALTYTGGKSKFSLCDHDATEASESSTAGLVNREISQVAKRNQFGINYDIVVATTRLSPQSRSAKEFVFLNKFSQIVEIDDWEYAVGSSFTKLGKPVLVQVLALDSDGDVFVNRTGIEANGVFSLQTFVSGDGKLLNSYQLDQPARTSSSFSPHREIIKNYAVASDEGWDNFEIVPTFAAFGHGVYQYGDEVRDRPVSETSVRIVSIDGQEVCAEGSERRDTPTTIEWNNALEPGKNVLDCLTKF